MQLAWLQSSACRPLSVEKQSCLCACLSETQSHVFSLCPHEGVCACMHTGTRVCGGVRVRVRVYAAYLAAITNAWSCACINSGTTQPLQADWAMRERRKAGTHIWEVQEHGECLVIGQRDARRKRRPIQALGVALLPIQQLLPQLRLPLLLRPAPAWPTPVAGGSASPSFRPSVH